MANKAGICSLDGCEKYGPLTRGWCHMHYRRFRKTGTPGPSQPMRAKMHSTPQELLDYWGYETVGDCWEATGFRNEDGYVMYSTSGKKISAHRASYMAKWGEIPQGAEICHTCDNPACIKPEHLYAGSHSDNMIDRSKRRRDPNMVLDEDKVRFIRQRISDGATNREIALDFKGEVSDAVIHTVRKGKTWAWVN